MCIDGLPGCEYYLMLFYGGEFLHLIFFPEKKEERKRKTKKNNNNCPPKNKNKNKTPDYFGLLVKRF